MKNYSYYIIALLYLAITSCSVNEELVMLEEVDDVYIRPDNTVGATQSETLVMVPLESMPDASDAERSFYQNMPYDASAADDAKALDSNGSNEGEEYYDYFDEDYAARLENFHGGDDEAAYNFSGSQNNYYPSSGAGPRISWNMAFGYNTWGPGSSWGMNIGFGNNRWPYYPTYCNSFYNPFAYVPPPYGYCDPFDPWCRNSWNNPYWGNPWGSPWGNPYGMSWYAGVNWMYPPYMYQPGFSPYYGNPYYADNPWPYQNFVYNNEQSSSRRSRGGLVSQGNGGSDGSSGGSGIVANQGTERNDARSRRTSGNDIASNDYSERTNTTRSRTERTPASRADYNRRSNQTTDRYSTSRRLDANNNRYSRSRVSPYTRETQTRSARSSTRNSTRYNSFNRTRSGSNSFYGNSSRSTRTTSPSFSPSRSSGGSFSPSRSAPSRRR